MYAVSGLGQAGFRVPDDVENGMRILGEMVMHWSRRAKAIGNQALVNRVELGGKYWARASELANFDGRFDAARQEIGRGIGYMQQIAPQVIAAEGQSRASGAFAPAVDAELRRVESGASFMEQVKQTLAGPSASLTETVASSVQAVSPAVAQTLRASAWIVPAAVVGGLLMFLRRR